MSDRPQIGPGKIVGWREWPGRPPVPIREVDPRVSAYLLHLVHEGQLTFEDTMRIVFPEEAAEIYDVRPSSAIQPGTIIHNLK